MDRLDGRQFGHQAVLLSTTHRSGLRRDSLGAGDGKEKYEVRAGISEDGGRVSSASVDLF